NEDTTEDDAEERLAAPERILGDRVAAGRREHHRDERAEPRVDHAVDEPAREDAAVLCEQRDQVVPGGRGVREPQAEGAEEVGRRLRRGDDHPDQRQKKVDGRDDEDQVDGVDAGSGGLAATARGIVADRQGARYVASCGHHARFPFRLTNRRNPNDTTKPSSATITAIAEARFELPCANAWLYAARFGVKDRKSVV